MKWQARVLDPEEVLVFIRLAGAANTKEVKDHFKTNSSSVRIAVGHLLIQDKVWVVAAKPKPNGWGPCAVFYMENTHEVGNPNPHKRRAEAGVLAKPGSDLLKGSNTIFNSEDYLNWEGWKETLVLNGAGDKKSYLAWRKKKEPSTLMVRFDLGDEVPKVEFGRYYETPDFWDEVPGYRP